MIEPALEPGNQKARWPSAPNPTDEQILLIGERAGFIAPEDLIREIDDLQLKYLAAYNAGMAHTCHGSAGDAFRAHTPKVCLYRTFLPNRTPIARPKPARILKLNSGTKRKPPSNSQKLTAQKHAKFCNRTSPAMFPRDANTPT